MFQRSARSAFTSPEPTRRSTTKARKQLTHSTSAPTISSPPHILNAARHRRQAAPEDAGEVAPTNIVNRCIKAVENLEQLARDRAELEKRVAVLSSYSDEHLAQNLSVVRSILETCVNHVFNETETNSRPIWMDLSTHLRESLVRYEAHLNSCVGRKEYLEAKECLRRVDEIIASASATNEENSRDSACASTTCCICFEAVVACSMLCGHLLCSDCAQSVQKCPLCRKDVLPEHLRPVFFS